MLPIIILLLSLAFRIKFMKAFKSSLTIGIGFIGIFTIFDFFVITIGPVIENLVLKTGLQYSVLDVGWPPLAAITWSYKLTPILLILILGINVIMLLLKWTDTINVDVWNYWHFIFISMMVYESTNNIFLSFLAGILSSVLIIKLADWSAKSVGEFADLKGISISTLSSIIYYPIGVIGDRILDRVPGIKNIKAEPEYIKQRLGIVGEPITIGFLMGSILGVGAGYEVKQVLDIAFKMSAVVYILPQMCKILGEGLMPVSDGIKDFLKQRFPNMGDKYIGLDVAVLMGTPSVVVTGLLLMPVALVLAFIIPGVNFIPLGDLPNIMSAVAMIVVACRGNIIRSFIISIPVIVGKLLVATIMSQSYTALAQKVQFTIEGYNGIITSFLDGGNIFRFWVLRLFEGKMWAFIILPLVGIILLAIRWDSKRKCL